MTKIVAIGVGSVVFGVELLRDVFQTPELRGAGRADTRVRPYESM